MSKVNVFTARDITPDTQEMVRNLRAEAAIDPDPVPTGEVEKETQIIAIYGMG